MRHQCAPTGTTFLFLQQPIRSLRGLRRAGKQVDLRPGQGDCGPGPPAARWRPGTRRRVGLHAAQPAGTGAEERDRSLHTVRAIPEEDAEPAAGSYSEDPRRDLRGRHRGLSRLAVGIHVAGGLPRLRRQAAEAREPGGPRQRALDRRIHRDADLPRTTHGQVVATEPARRADCGAGGG